MPTTSAAVKQLSDQNTNGTVMGTSSTDVIGFYGLTQGIVQPAVSGSISSGALASSVAAALTSLGLIRTTYSA